MTGGGGLLVCLLSLTLTMAASRPPICSKVHQWIVNGKNLLENASGNVTLVALLRATSSESQQLALSLDTTFLDLLTNGIPVSFFGVNSKEARSELRNLQTKISFPVYQESDGEDIWTTMDGRDNDVFVYDRCSRFAYFSPHSLNGFQDSMLRTLLPDAILFTYNNSYCGISCLSNDIFEIIKKQTKNDQQPFHGNPPDEEGSETVYHPDGMGVLLDIEENFPILGKGTPGEYEAMGDYEDMDVYDDRIINYDGFSNVTTSNDVTENSNFSENQSTTPVSSLTRNSVFSKVFNFFWGDGKPNHHENSVENKTIHQSLPSNLTNDIQIEPIMVNNGSNLDPTTTPSTESNSQSNHEDGKMDSCDGIDENVCKEWSKRKLMHAQRCCAGASRNQANRRGKGCDHYGRKRCKKIQPLLKCCLKTELLSLSVDEQSAAGTM